MEFGITDCRKNPTDFWHWETSSWQTKKVLLSSNGLRNGSLETYARRRGAAYPYCPPYERKFSHLAHHTIPNTIRCKEKYIYILLIQLWTWSILARISHFIFKAFNTLQWESENELCVLNFFWFTLRSRTQDATRNVFWWPRATSIIKNSRLSLARSRIYCYSKLCPCISRNAKFSWTETRKFNATTTW